MGSVRNWEFDAVIGVGGIGSEASSHSIDGKINWVGIGAHKGEIHGGGPLVWFDKFILYEETGPDFLHLAPNLAARVYEKNIRQILHSLTLTEKHEAENILRLAENSSSSTKKVQTLQKIQTRGSCGPKCCPRPRC